MRLRAEELPAGPWMVVQVEELLTRLAPRRGGRSIVAVDGRSSSGKTTLAGRLAAAHGAAAVVHTDDIAWWHSRFGWEDLLIGGILEPFRSNGAASFRPSVWDERGREGAVVVPGGVSLLVVEGIGSSRRALRSWFDTAVWVQADEDLIVERNHARIAAGETTSSGLAAWLVEEVAFLAHDQPWERADVIVAGSADLIHEPETEVVVAGGVPVTGAGEGRPSA